MKNIVKYNSNTFEEFMDSLYDQYKFDKKISELVEDNLEDGTKPKLKLIGGID